MNANELADNLIPFATDYKISNLDCMILSDAITMLRQQQAEIEQLNKALEFKDQPDQWTDEIAESHPLKTGDHETYATAMEMVGNRHGKFELVALVNWLLKKASEK